MSKNTMVGASRMSFNCNANDTTTYDEIKHGCLQRIALSLEGIEAQLRYSNNRAQYNEKRLRNLEVRNRNLRKKLKEKV